MCSITGTVLSGPGGLEVQLTSSQLQLCGSSPENLRAAAEVIWEYSLIKWVSQNASGFYNFNFFSSTASVSALMSEHLWVQTNTFLLFYFQKSHKKDITSIWLAQLCTKIKIKKFKKEKSQTFTLVAALWSSQMKACLIKSESGTLWIYRDFLIHQLQESQQLSTKSKITLVLWQI